MSLKIQAGRNFAEGHPGIILAWSAQVWIASMLAIKQMNPAAFDVGGLLLCVIAVLAALAPARRAMNVIPMHALRND